MTRRGRMLAGLRRGPGRDGRDAHGRSHPAEGSPRLATHRPAITASAAALVVVAALVAACSGGGSPAADGPSVVVTTTVLGSIVKDLVGDAGHVTVLMGNGVDPHDWSPSAKDIEAVERADLVVANGLGLEQSLEEPIGEAEKRGVAVFRAADHVVVRRVGDAADPHLWTDPIAMRDVAAALATELAAVGVDVGTRAADLKSRLDDLDAEVRTALEPIPAAGRRLVTGHESMGYFADRYGLTLVGAVMPGLTSQGEVSAGELADLKAVMEREGVRAIFTEIGTPAAVVEAIAAETGATVVELPSHTLPDDGSYFTFIRQIAAAIAGALA